MRKTWMQKAVRVATMTRRMKRSVLFVKLSCLAVMLVSLPLWAADDETELAKASQNPVADLISIPGLGRVVDEGCQFLAAAPGYPAGGWVAHLECKLVLGKS